MTQDEIQALVELLNRIPVTQAERLWLRDLLQRLAQGQAAAPTDEPAA